MKTPDTLKKFGMTFEEVDLPQGSENKFRRFLIQDNSQTVAVFDLWKVGKQKIGNVSWDATVSPEQGNQLLQGIKASHIPDAVIIQPDNEMHFLRLDCRNNFVGIDTTDSKVDDRGVNVMYKRNSPQETIRRAFVATAQPGMPESDKSELADAITTLASRVIRQPVVVRK